LSILSDFNDIRECYGQVLAHHGNVIRRMCWSYASGDKARFDEMLQECRLSIWRHIGTLRPDASQRQTRKWVEWQCRSTFSHHRRKQRGWLLIDDTMADRLPDLRDDGLRDVVEELAADLNSRERQVLTFILEGYTSEEIASIMELALRSVYTIRYRMLKKMKKKWEEIEKM
jgi:RNA polymerase sigma factor (sigma-70 family)